MTKLLFEGTATALVTPFTKSGVDFRALDNLLDYQINGKVNAVVVLGTTGEPATMTQAEKDAVLTFVVQKLKGKIPIIVGAGTNSTAQAVENCTRAETLGADGLLVVTPYYNKCTQTGLLKHYETTACATKLPIIVYNVPSRTGVNMLPSTFSQIAEIDNVVGIKEASGNMAQIAKVASLVKGKAAVYSGDDGLTIPIMSIGGKGVISVVSNVLPAFVSTMTRMWLDGETTIAQDMQLSLLPLVDALFEEVNPIPVKKACEILGLAKSAVRPPLTPASKRTSIHLRKELAKFVTI